MSKLYVMSVRDRASDAFMPPVFVAATGQGIRWFGDEINNPECPWSRHPDDYDLYVLGTYDQTSGTFDVNTPMQLAVGKDLVRKNS